MTYDDLVSYDDLVAYDDLIFSSTPARSNINLTFSQSLVATDWHQKEGIFQKILMKMVNKKASNHPLLAPSSSGDVQENIQPLITIDP